MSGYNEGMYLRVCDMVSQPWTLVDENTSLSLSNDIGNGT